jgi:cellulose synthase/poly-beta-1,6-N-acetylglucosamine synthase-like glycosyltransferase
MSPRNSTVQGRSDRSPQTLSGPAAVSELDRAVLAGAVRRLSGGNVVEIRPSGPVLSKTGARRRSLSPETFVPALGIRDRVLIAGLTAGWVTCVVAFWIWWLEPVHRVGWVGLVLNSLLLFNLSIQPVYFVIAVNRLRKVDLRITVPSVRTAFVVTRAPSEPWSVAHKTLTAMLAQRYPHPYDVWLCDEQTTPEIAEWCREHDVRISTRFGVTAYHRPDWPRRTRCKEGNLSYFYDQVGYQDYDVVAQLDCDHVPSPDYLAEMVRPFADPSIGYVSAPSICDANVENSWSARGRLYREANFHGPSQLGHSGGLAPVCIGSHYAVRTRAVRDIGGIGPELAEDFSTSFLLNSAGWNGAFAIDAEAHGDGPLTFSAMLVQEFQWSRSLTTVLYALAPRHVGRMAWRLRLRFVYALTYYVLLALATVGGLALAPIAAISGAPWINVNYPDFLLRWWSVSIWLVLLTVVLRRRGLLRPLWAPIVSWENWLYCLTRWPYIVWGVAAATLQQLRPRPITFKVTPKSTDGLERLPARLVAPFVAISVVLSGSALAGELITREVGYVFLCLLGSATYCVVASAVCFLHASEAARTADITRRRAFAQTAGSAALAVSITIPCVITAIALFPDYAIRIFHW